jgi:hypothetical protein
LRNHGRHKWISFESSDTANVLLNCSKVSELSRVHFPKNRYMEYERLWSAS